jgi:hypothetical protein
MSKLTPHTFSNAIGGVPERIHMINQIIKAIKKLATSLLRVLLVSIRLDGQFIRLKKKPYISD